MRDHQQTTLIHGGQLRSHFDETSEALYLTSGFVYANAETAADAFADKNQHYIYSRYSNPTVTMFEEKARLLEGAAAAQATASGMAAVFASMMCQLRAGDKVVAAKALFGSCDFIVRNILPKYGIEVGRVDGANLRQWRRAITPKTKLVFFETPANPTLELIDIGEVAKLAHDQKAVVVVDNVFATPILQKPFKHGADIVVYSATKHIDGQGRTLGGLIFGSKEFCKETLLPFIRNTGPSLSPFNAWVLLKGMETLAIRVAAQCERAQALVELLKSHPKVERVFYPALDDNPQAAIYEKQMGGGGSIVTFTLKDCGRAQVFEFINRLRLLKISNNLGDSRSLVTHPATTTHHRLGEAARLEMGVGENMVRVSLGLEETRDILDDVSRSLGSI